MDSPLDPNSTTVRVGRDDDREDDVRAPALEIGVPRAIPVATAATERIRVYLSDAAGGG